MDGDQTNQERIEALTLEWVSWLTKAAHDWRTDQIFDKLKERVPKSCEWVDVIMGRIATEGIFVVRFAVPAVQIRNDLPDVDLSYLVELLNTEPGREIGATLETDSFGDVYVVLERYYYIPLECRSNWFTSNVIPEREREIICSLFALTDANESLEVRKDAVQRLVNKGIEVNVRPTPPPPLS